MTIVVATLALAAIPAAYVGATDTFSDVPTSAYYHDEVNAIFNAGITSGCSSTRYCPGSPVTRGQMAVFLNKLGALSAGEDPVVDALSDQGTMVFRFVHDWILAGGATTECETGGPTPPVPGDTSTVQYQLFDAPGSLNPALVNVQLRDDGDPTNGYQVCFRRLVSGNLDAGTYRTYGQFTVYIGVGLFASEASAAEAREASRAAKAAR